MTSYTFIRNHKQQLLSQVIAAIQNKKVTTCLRMYL